MKRFNNINSIIVLVLLLASSALAQRIVPASENAALRYWSAFSEIHDASITAQQAKEVNAILDGTAPYDDSAYKELLKKNTLALDIMARGSSLRHCDWGLDYGLGPNMPVDYARKALILGRLNVLYAFHLLRNGNKDGAVHTLAAGLLFSHDVGDGGSLFATLVAKRLIVSHLRALADGLPIEKLSAAQRSELQSAVAQLGEGLDWSMAAQRDLEALRGPSTATSQAAAESLRRIVSSYVAVLSDESKLPVLKQALESAPPDLANLIPHAEQVLEQKRELHNALQQARSLLQ